MYGEFRWENKYKTWDRMRHLHHAHNLPWLLSGDLNKIQSLHEKEGGNPRPQQYMHAFQNAIDDCERRDMGFLGDKFTWHRGRIRERIDRGLVNEAWDNVFPMAALENLQYNHSDHRPLLVNTEHYTVPVHGDGRRLRFESRWLREAQFNDSVMDAWQKVGSDPTANSVYEKLNRMHAMFHDWDQRVLKKPKQRLRKAQHDLERVMRGPINDNSEEARKQLSELIEYLLELEEIHMMQMSRISWLKNGDRNTGFFQAYASARRKRNFIKKLKDSDGNWMEGTTKLNPHIQSYFSNLFTSEVQYIDPSILYKVNSKVTARMNNMLLAPYTPDDVCKAVFSIGDLKAPEPDGLHAVFFKKYWHILGEEITQEVLIAINSRQIPAEWYATTIVLIPKVDSPEMITQFRPISLCNVIFKIAEKVLAN